MERPTATGILLRTTGSVATRHPIRSQCRCPTTLNKSGRVGFCASSPVSRRVECSAGYVWTWMRLGLLLSGMHTRVWAADQSPPPILQWFESSYQTIEERAPDLFLAGLRVRLDSPALPCRPG